MQPNESEASIFVLPTWRGRTTLDIWTPGHDHQTLAVEVTMWLVLILCLSGGIVGGIAAKETLKGRAFAQIPTFATFRQKLTYNDPIVPETVPRP